MNPSRHGIIAAALISRAQTYKLTPVEQVMVLKTAIAIIENEMVAASTAHALKNLFDPENK